MFISLGRAPPRFGLELRMRGVYYYRLAQFDGTAIVCLIKWAGRAVMLTRCESFGLSSCLHVHELAFNATYLD